MQTASIQTAVATATTITKLSKQTTGNSHNIWKTGDETNFLRLKDAEEHIQILLGQIAAPFGFWSSYLGDDTIPTNHQQTFADTL